MEKTENEKKEDAERRQDFRLRLRIAVRRAHDPLFTPAKPPTEKTPTPRHDDSAP